LAKKRGRSRGNGGLTSSVNVLNLFQNCDRVLGKEQTGWIIRGAWEENGGYPRHRDTEEHEKLKGAWSETYIKRGAVMRRYT
jgi:hypothetical protein